ncbi:hypothetical protein D3C74_256480 [compost metagenome]
MVILEHGNRIDELVPTARAFDPDRTDLRTIFGVQPNFDRSAGRSASGPGDEADGSCRPEIDVSINRSMPVLYSAQLQRAFRATL